MTGAVLAWSVAGLLVRLVGLDAWMILFWRGLFAAAAIATALAWLCLRERIAAGAVAAGLAALAGVGIMVGGAAEAGSLPGSLLAVAVTLLMAAMMVLLRRHRDTRRVPAALLSAAATTALALPFASPITPGPATLGLLALFGVVQMALASPSSSRAPAARPLPRPRC